MARYITRTWIAEAASGLPRSARRSCRYDAYVPDTLASRVFRLDGDVAADVADAETAIVQLDSRAVALTDTEALARLLLRAESVASSWIEGLAIGPRRLMRAEAARQMGASPSDVTAEEILGNIDAMRLALEVAEDEAPITVDTLLEMHRQLLAGTRIERHAGRLRETQNWLGGSSYNPCSAEYVPPPPEEVPALLEDLCAFLNSDMLSAVAQAAIAHAQFETIHPFADGNGRVGRALVHLVMRRRRLSQNIQPPVSLILATHKQDYIAGLEGFRYDGASESEEAYEGLNRWIATFASACTRSVQDAVGFEARCDEIGREWRAKIGSVRSGSSVDLLLRTLPGTPIISVKSAMALVGRSKPQVNEAVARLERAGILKQVTVGRRNRAFEAPAIIDAFTDLERQLASPAGDTQVDAPTRPVSARKDTP